MSQQNPKLPSRPRGIARPEATQQTTAPRTNSSAGLSQQAMRDKGRQRGASERDEEEDCEAEDTRLGEWLCQSPSWLTSMVVHMILLTVLALWALPQEIKDNFKEIVLGEPEIVEKDKLGQEPNEPLIEKPRISYLQVPGQVKTLAN